MNSKQINFFITPDDYTEIIKFFNDRHCKILKGDIKKNSVINSYDIVSNREKIFQVYICKKEYEKLLSIEHLEDEKYFIGILKSYCIEFDIGGFYPYSNKELQRGRLYYVLKYYSDHDRAVEKEQGFKDWADTILKEFKKRFLIKSVEYPQLLFSKNGLELVKRNNAELAAGGTKFLL